ncbi:hypothetical protein ACVHL3_003546 [Escherichia coli]
MSDYVSVGDAPPLLFRIATSQPYMYMQVSYGITPFLPKTANQPSTRFITGFMKDLSKKRILFQFGFTRDNVG